MTFLTPAKTFILLQKTRATLGRELSYPISHQKGGGRQGCGKWRKSELREEGGGGQGLGIPQVSFI